jgi:hypothetical protein
MLRILDTIKTIKRKKVIATIFHLCSLSSFPTLTYMNDLNVFTGLPELLLHAANDLGD